MHLVMAIVAVLIGLLSIAAGAAKVALIPAEVEFLSQFGFTNGVTIAIGVAQVLGGLLVLIPTTRFYGGLVVGLLFLVSAALLLVAGDAAFAGISLLPVALAGLVAYRTHAAVATD